MKPRCFCVVHAVSSLGTATYKLERWANTSVPSTRRFKFSNQQFRFLVPRKLQAHERHLQSVSVVFARSVLARHRSRSISLQNSLFNRGSLGAVGRAVLS